MEFKLNKIDTDVRKKIQEDIKEDKVHSSKNISIKREIRDEQYEEIEELNEKDFKRRYITIDGVKDRHKNINIEVEKTEKINEVNSKGISLDTRK